MSICIVVSDGTRCCMASDSQATNNGSKVTLPRPKFTRFGPLLISWPSFPVADALLHPDAPSTDTLGSEGLHFWAAMRFVPWLREQLGNAGLMENGDHGEKFLPGPMLVAWKSAFVVVDTNGGVFEPRREWHAHGSGREVADGAAYVALQAEHGQADQVARAAVEAACFCESSCSVPVHLAWTEP